MEHDGIKFSLILATVGRSEELTRFLRHLDQQTYRNFELIIVDQNSNGILDSLIRQYQEDFHFCACDPDVGYPARGTWVCNIFPVRSWLFPTTIAGTLQTRSRR